FFHLLVFVLLILQPPESLFDVPHGQQMVDLAIDRKILKGYGVQTGLVTFIKFLETFPSLRRAFHDIETIEAAKIGIHFSHQLKKFTDRRGIPLALWPEGPTRKKGQ